MARKPDLFEQMVLDRMRQLDSSDDPCVWLDGPDVVTLLRRYHAKVREIVRKQRKIASSMHTPDLKSGHEAACNSILHNLARLKKGKL